MLLPLSGRISGLDEGVDCLAQMFSGLVAVFARESLHKESDITGTEELMQPESGSQGDGGYSC